MISCDLVKSLSVQAEEDMIEDIIDGKILDEAKKGGYFCTFVVYQDNDKLFDIYKKVLKRYKGYKITYGVNHVYSNLITVSWK